MFAHISSSHVHHAAESTCIDTQPSVWITYIHTYIHTVAAVIIEVSWNDFSLLIHSPLSLSQQSRHSPSHLQVGRTVIHILMWHFMYLESNQILSLVIEIVMVWFVSFSVLRSGKARDCTMLRTSQQWMQQANDIKWMYLYIYNMETKHMSVPSPHVPGVRFIWLNKENTECFLQETLFSSCFAGGGGETVFLNQLCSCTEICKRHRQLFVSSSRTLKHRQTLCPVSGSMYWRESRLLT